MGGGRGERGGRGGESRAHVGAFRGLGRFLGEPAGWRGCPGMGIHAGDKNAMRDTSDHIRFIKFTQLEFRQYVELVLKVTGRGVKMIF